jgi:hypothetical protein
VADQRQILQIKEEMWLIKVDVGDQGLQATTTRHTGDNPLSLKTAVISKSD